ncbi:MAG: large conductance mechanosensitive channel protein MscL [Saprospiraceae bacterium]
MLKEFREFIMRGNVVDLAIAVIIGAAFGAVISSLVDDVITPLLLTPALRAAGAEDIGSLTWGAVKYGKFIAAILKFLVIAFVLFLIVKSMNQFKKKEVAGDAGPTQEQLLMEIRDLLRNR